MPMDMITLSNLKKLREDWIMNRVFAAAKTGKKQTQFRYVHGRKMVTELSDGEKSFLRSKGLLLMEEENFNSIEGRTWTTITVSWDES